MQKELNAIESGFGQTGETEQGVVMTETEKILTQAEDIARRIFEEPTQQTVMQLFARLCDEQDMRELDKPACSAYELH
ncbi:hypothetical protein EGK70_007220 [Alcaligenes aquatilis]|uniref:hypothetical protein n=1 Tax=Alcaligenes aquatilis TaxID=323284 RepID=UPI000F6775D7|nr:hypothetical protein [Alcaligenes aquatilis]QXR38048.1 hypothetical protein EGK70_007220 [Alcaligenes aquatilis]